MPVVIIDEEKEKTHKTGYITLHTKLFKGVIVHLKNGRLKKTKSFYIPMTNM
jgi:hypothetical protein